MDGRNHWSVFKKFMDELELSLTSADIKPNKFHYLISKWQKETNDEFTIITTNIDDLHEQAGNKNVIHIHGLNAILIKKEHLIMVKLYQIAYYLVKELIKFYK